jgi:diaminohydroxyphosphoribosylaminopyrimidine deaminase/5-amino-6-(5-phosphoribosylamino)uracil reductase
VVFALEDPNPRVSGRGAEALRGAGVAVESGLMAAEAAEINPGFLKRMRSGRPWVRVKLAMSLDGRTALANGESRWITGPLAREDVQHWRAQSSAILTGIGTVLADDPRLDVRLPDPPSGPRPQPLRVVLDARLQTPPGARLLAGGRVLIVTAAIGGEEDPERAARRAGLAARGAAFEEVPLQSGAAAGRLSLPDVLELLGRHEINEVWVEAGPGLAGAMLSQGLADELIVYVAPKLLGPQARPLVQMSELGNLHDAPGFLVLDTRQIGDDIRLHARPRQAPTRVPLDTAPPAS